MAGLKLGHRGATPDEIVATLRDLDESSGFNKYSKRRDGGLKAYASIAQAAVQPRKSSAESELTWEQVESAVADDPIGEPYYMDGADGPRRRFVLHTDRGAISKLRIRLNEVWMENRLLEGDQTGYDRASHCGELHARKCKRCGVVQCDGHKSRFCCKQRMHPLCMGIQARRPLWSKRDLIGQESNLAAYVITLGSYDIGEEVPQWVSYARGMIGQAYEWLRLLADRKDCPDSVKTSFTGFRADLHQGYLTLDLVLLGPTSFRASSYLRGYFQQVTERDTEVEVIACSNAEEAINTFGNLMSSMAVYNTADECQALMAAFKGRRLVQPRGRFLKRSDQSPSEEQTGDVSNNPPGSLLETSRCKPPRGGGEKPPPCHECGGETVSIGRIGGNWKKVKGRFSGQVYWLLADPPGGGP
jgi:hypothetical protein